MDIILMFNFLNNILTNMIFLEINRCTVSYNVINNKFWCWSKCLISGAWKKSLKETWKFLKLKVKKNCNYILWSQIHLYSAGVLYCFRFEDLVKMMHTQFKFLKSFLHLHPTMLMSSRLLVQLSCGLER